MALRYRKNILEYVFGASPRMFSRPSRAAKQSSGRYASGLAIRSARVAVWASPTPPHR
jgi:hypothetical protein